MPPTNASPKLPQQQQNTTPQSTPQGKQTSDQNASQQQQQQQLRPPLYNAEDYASALRHLFTNSLSLPPPPPTSLILEHSSTHPPVLPTDRLLDMNRYSSNNKSCSSQFQPEMGMKKFINGSELLFKLEADLRSAYPSFVQEFVSGEFDGVACILDALRNIHEALDHVNGLREQRKLVLDERSCVQCVCLMMRNSDTVTKLLSYPHGLYSIVHCTVSTNTNTRVLALEILTNICECGSSSIDAYMKVSEAISTLRLRLGEPTRCKVLVGAISSASAGIFQATGIRFLRSFVGCAPSAKYRVYLQVELEEAGFCVEAIRKSAELSPARESRLVIQEIEEWERVCVDVDTVVRQNSQLRNSVALLQQEIATLKDKMKKSSISPSSNNHSNENNSSKQHQQQSSSSNATQKQSKRHQQQSHSRRLATCSTPIQTITTPVDSEEEAEQIHQILEDLHNIVNNEMLSNESSTSNSEIVPILRPRDPLPLSHNFNNRTPLIRSEPNLFESEDSTTDGGLLDTSHTNVRDVVQQLEQSSLFANTLPNFNVNGLASKFANFKSSKLGGSSSSHHHDNGWGESPGHRVKSLENLDNFTLKWKYPCVVGDNKITQHQHQQQNGPNSLVVLQDYRMNRFSKGANKGKSTQQQENKSSSSGGGGGSSGLFKKKIHAHPQKTFQISLVSKQFNGETKMTNLSFNDLGGGNSSGGNGNNGNGAGDNNSRSGGSPNLERVTDLPSGLY